MGAFILVLALSAYLWRIVVPVNAQVLGFPSLFDLPQYLGLFIVGLAAARSDWLMKMPDAMAKRFFRIALIASATLLTLSLIGTVVTSLGWGSLVGYGSLSSAFYALWDSTFAVGMTMFAVSFFRKRFNSPGRLWSFAAKNFYAAYFLQATVIVTFSALLLYQVHLESLLKFALGGGSSYCPRPGGWRTSSERYHTSTGFCRTCSGNPNLLLCWESEVRSSLAQQFGWNGQADSVGSRQTVVMGLAVIDIEVDARHERQRPGRIGAEDESIYTIEGRMQRMKKAFVLVNTDLGSEAEVKTELKKVQDIVGVYEVYGVYDLVVEAEAESDAKLKEIIFSKIRPLKHVRSTLTLNTV